MFNRLTHECMCLDAGGSDCEVTGEDVFFHPAMIITSLSARRSGRRTGTGTESAGTAEPAWSTGSTRTATANVLESFLLRCSQNLAESGVDLFLKLVELSLLLSGEIERIPTEVGKDLARPGRPAKPGAPGTTRTEPRGRRSARSETAGRSPRAAWSARSQSAGRSSQ